MATCNTEDEELGTATSTLYLDDLSGISSGDVEVNVAITGEVGSGRSSFVNLITGLNPKTENSARPGECLLEGQPSFSPPDKANIKFWILPKIDCTFPRNDHELQQYDIFLIFTAAVFTTAHERFAERAKRINKPFFLIRTKINRDLPNVEEENKSTKAKLKSLRESLPGGLKKLYGRERKVYLVDNEINKFDFGKLVEAIVDSLPSPQNDHFRSIPIVQESIAWDDFQRLIQGLSDKTSKDFSATRESLLQHGIVQFQRLMKEEIKLYEEVKINFAVVGYSGVGKSSFINAIRGLRDLDPLAAQTGVTETTKEPTRFCHPENENISFWDLPGFGSTTLPDMQTFCEKVKIEAYDAFLIICAVRFTDFEIQLAGKVQSMGKSLFLIRTKIDHDVESMRRKYGGVFDERKLLETLKCKCAENGNFSEDDIFLISSWYPEKWEFVKLRRAIVDRLPDIQKGVLILSLRANSKDMMNEKITILKDRVWKVTLTSCALGVIGYILNIDVMLIKHQIKSYSRKLEFPEIDSHEFKVLPEELQIKIQGLNYRPQHDKDIVSWLKQFDRDNSYNIRKIGPCITTNKPFTFVYGFLNMMLDKMGEIAIAILDQTAKNTK